MSDIGLVVVGLVIAVGVAGSVLPILPGLPVAWAAILFWALAEGEGSLRWVVVAVATFLTVVGVAAKFLLSGRKLRDLGAPRRTLVAATVGGVVGFFVIPVVGIFVGIAAGALLAEYVRLGTFPAAWSSARAVLIALGLGTLIEVAAGVVMGLVWLGGALAV